MAHLEPRPQDKNPSTEALPDEPFDRGTIITLLLATFVILYGLASMACGQPANSVPDDPPTAQGRDTPGPPVGHSSEAEGVEGEDDATTPPGTTAPTPDLVRFAVDEAGVEMAIVMGRHARIVGQKAIPTSAVISGDWFIENFEFQQNNLTTTVDESLSEDVIIAMRHRQADAELLAWMVAEEPAQAERYLDAVADDMLGRFLNASSLREVAGPTEAVPDNRLALKGLAFDTTLVDGRSALQIEMLRTHPRTNVMLRTRVVMIRQQTKESSVLLCFALSARRDDYPDLALYLDDLIEQVTLTAQVQPLSLNPRRALGPAGDEYGIPLQPLDSPAAEVPPAVAPPNEGAAPTAETPSTPASPETPEDSGTTPPATDEEDEELPLEDELLGPSGDSDDNSQRLDEDAQESTPIEPREERGPSVRSPRGL